NTGGSVHLTELVDELKDLVHLKVVCDCGEDFEEDGVEFYDVDSGIFSLLSFPEIWSLSREADLVHTRADPFELAGPLAAWLQGLPVVGEVNVNFLAYERKHSLRDLFYPLFHLIKWLWLKLVVKRYDRVLTVSRTIADELENLGFSQEQLEVVRNGGNPERFEGVDQGEAREELGLEQEGYVVLLMGELGPRHGLDRLVGSDMEDVTFLVLGGTDKYTDFIEKQKEEAGENFVFHDPVP
ncbi:MAG: glycosyltransferase, partial [Candidatus Nanohaloarchaea archaeon]|nr:glycosyltransferase [Candidatus Nanohaloarchaea archaeon]